MLSLTRMIRHLAYFEVLAALDERDDAWREISAGLVALRRRRRISTPIRRRPGA